MYLIKKYLIILQIFPIIFLLSNCSSFNKKVNTTQPTDIEIYSKGLVLLKEGNFKKATSEFDDLLLNHPFSNFSSKSEIMSAYSNFQNNEVKKAITKLNSYIEMNPAGELTQYAHYLLAMCYYSQVSSESRDPSLSIKALNYFKLIVTKYPNTKYSKDSNLKIQYLENSLAKNELIIGKFYLRKGAPASSIKRFKYILENYQNSYVIPETLYRLSEALLMIGLKEEAMKSSVLLNYNFPNNNWTNKIKKLFENNTQLNQSQSSGSSFINYLKKLF